jgi:hypothetical protein
MYLISATGRSYANSDDICVLVSATPRPDLSASPKRQSSDILRPSGRLRIRRQEGVRNRKKKFVRLIARKSIYTRTRCRAGKVHITPKGNAATSPPPFLVVCGLPNALSNSVILSRPKHQFKTDCIIFGKRGLLYR